MSELSEIYDILLERFGKQNWWPVKSKLKKERVFEIILGSILTQRTSWKNVEPCLENLRKNNLFNPSSLLKVRPERLRKLLRKAGFKKKAEYILNFSKYILENYNGSLETFFLREKKELRKELLSLKGIGKETADNILLYSGNKLVFPIDFYTIRIFNRIGIREFGLKGRNYDKFQEFFHKNLPRDLEVYKEFRALLVKLGKEYCKSKPKCNSCPLKEICKKKM